MVTLTPRQLTLKKYRDKNRKELNEKSRQYRAEHKEADIAYRAARLDISAKYREDNKERCLLQQAVYRETHRSERRSRDREIYLKNPGIKHAHNRLRAVGKIHRTPDWSDHKLIEEFYILSKKLESETGIKHHVDHIIPLQGRLVSGLHVESNLQVITATENLHKSNKY